MKKLMLSAAVAALALSAAPAMAQDESGVKLNFGGAFNGYVNYTNEDGDFLLGGGANAGAQEPRSFDILRETELLVGGETTLDNGLTVGANMLANVDAGEDFQLDETYAYFSGTWGRVNFGDEDGAAYLLQVAAPSADENVDGIRPDINPFNGLARINYANSVAGDADKITYLTPVFSGFQAGLTYTPTAVADGSIASRGAAGNSLDGGTELEDIYEVAVRYEGEMSGVGLALGAGYTAGSQETDTVANDDFKEWNVGADANFGAFGLGVVYTENNNADAVNDKNETMVVGADYTTGAYKLGASYLTNESNSTGASVDTDRYAVGAQYQYGPGMSFRGTVSYYEADAATDTDGTAVTVGTQINF